MCDRPSADRLRTSLDEIAAISDTPDHDEGITRLAYTETERGAHRRFRDWMADLGLRTWTDAFGNSYAEYPGAESLPAIGTGSHLDAVPGGGRFDGVVGVVAAAEVARLLVAGGVRTRHPVRFVAFAAEEGARFGQGCIGSRAAAGLWTADALRSTRDAAGVSVLEAMTAVGLAPGDPAAARWEPAEWSAFVELHVEQGTVLEGRGAQIGIVTMVSGNTRLCLQITGVAGHSGGTPMSGRKDALCAASELVLFVEASGQRSGDDGLRLTVGRMVVEPNSPTTIPGSVSLWVDIRGSDLKGQRAAADEMLRECERLESERGVAIRHRRVGEVAPTALPDRTRQAVRDAAAGAGVTTCELTSGASHDSQVICAVVPTAIIFVPSRHGLSHVPQEYTDIDDIARGASVLLDTLLRLDRQRDDRVVREEGSA